jgi:hypothetical protein
LKIEIFAHNYDLIETSAQILEQKNSILLASFYLSSLPLGHEYASIMRSVPFFGNVSFTKFKLSMRLLQIKDEIISNQDYVKFSKLFEIDVPILQFAEI